MNILIVYDSFFGNTEKIARVIGSSFGEANSVKTVRVQDFTSDLLKDTELLVVGSPTRAFRPSEGISGFLEEIPAKSLNGIRVAAFDTRSDVTKIKSGLLKFMAKTFGYAAPAIAKKLESKGGKPAVSPEGFFVEDSEGPLREGEEERAAGWLSGLSA
jgi:flavodoxin